MSIISFAANVGLTVLLHEVCQAPEEMAFGVALVVVFLVNFFAMRHYIYEGKAGHAVGQFAVYTGSAISFRVTEYLSFLLLHSWLRFDYRLVLVTITSSSAVVKFCYYRLVFEGTSNNKRSVMAAEKEQSR